MCVQQFEESVETELMQPLVILLYGLLFCIQAQVTTFDFLSRQMIH
jgi:hypothetical protein